jgi:hypothetical protein
MVEANNGNEGNNGEHNGYGRNDGGHDMDMDHRGNATNDTSNENQNGASNVNNGVEGMQENLESFSAIQVGTMSVQFNNPGIISSEKNLSKKEQVYTSLSNVDFMPLRDKLCTDSDADPMLRVSGPGSMLAGTREGRLSAAVGQKTTSSVGGGTAASGDAG